jgi:hypothetical protein
MSGFRQMVQITKRDYEKFIQRRKTVTIENVKMELPKRHVITSYGPEDYERETTTVWSFPDRGDWATHRGNYRGNWSPYIPRNVILRYSELGDLVLDQMVGSGTTLVECKLLGRRGIGVDINRDAIMVTRNRLDFRYTPEGLKRSPSIKTYVGDARNLNEIKDNTVDLIATHPPYAYILTSPLDA